MVLGVRCIRDWLEYECSFLPSFHFVCLSLFSAHVLEYRKCMYSSACYGGNKILAIEFREGEVLRLGASFAIIQATHPA